jgi:phosphoenolpyruvate synthase/pyruvate phosphate dikinase
MDSKRPPSTHVRWFEEVSVGDVPLVGGENASLCEMYRALTGRGVTVPNGFAVTADAYRYLHRQCPEVGRSIDLSVTEPAKMGLSEPESLRA